MDEQNRICNTEKVLYTQADDETGEAEDEAPCRPDGLILGAFKPEFLFQDLRIALYKESGQ